MVKNKKRKVRIASRKSKFFCPESPYIAWHHGLIFAECPASSGDRNSPECKRCPLRGSEEIERKNDRRRYKKDIPKLERRGKEPIPNIGKTYVGESKVSD